MKERPILFSGPMVRAILSGQKTQTRRPIKPQPTEGAHWAPEMGCALHEDHWGNPVGTHTCPFGVPGDRLWVREAWGMAFAQYVPADRFRLNGGTWGCPAHPEWSPCVVYSADGGMPSVPDGYETACWTPSIHMPRWASRITLEVTEVRVQRLRDITTADIVAEGVTVPDVDYSVPEFPHVLDAERDACASVRFSSLWDSVYSKTAPWHSNPWVWAVSFRRAQ